MVSTANPEPLRAGQDGNQTPVWYKGFRHFLKEHRLKDGFQISRFRRTQASKVINSSNFIEGKCPGVYGFTNPNEIVLPD
jgi:hypothetical protein